MVVPVADRPKAGKASRELNKGGGGADDAVAEGRGAALANVSACFLSLVSRDWDGLMATGTGLEVALCEAGAAMGAGTDGGATSLHCGLALGVLLLLPILGSADLLTATLWRLGSLSLTGDGGGVVPWRLAWAVPLGWAGVCAMCRRAC